jgi:hypothetical protein
MREQPLSQFSIPGFETSASVAQCSNQEPGRYNIVVVPTAIQHVILFPSLPTMAPTIYSFMKTRYMESSSIHSPSTILSRASSSDNHLTCAHPVPGLVGGPLYANSDITFHKLTILISAPCLAVTAISSGYLAWKHVRNYTAPQEQRQILRIIALPVFYSLFNFLALCWYRTYQFIQPLSQVYESFAIAALFFLILEWVCPEGTDREKFFDEFPFKDKKGVVVEGGSLAWFKVSPFTSPVLSCRYRDF